jgi:zinc D-Ala-D-Ala carboxypeptidase
MPPKPHFFTDAEIEGLDSELVAKLDWARGRSGVPFVITSGKRSEDHNETVGGVKDSAHTRGLAVDLRCADGEVRYKMLNALFLAGFKRIGIYDKHIHADLDPSLPQEVAWVGISH